MRKIFFVMTLIPAFWMSQIVAYSAIIDFETIPEGTPYEGLSINTQFLASHGVEFILENDSSPVLAQVGDPMTAFSGYPNNEGSDTVNPTQNVGSFFLTDDGVVSGPPSPLIVKYSSAVAAASGVILDIDGVEAWEIQARDSTDVTLETITLDTYSPNSGDGLSTFWSFSRLSADIFSIRIEFVGESNTVGLAFDNFSPSSVTPIPEVPIPATVLLLGSGIVGLAGFRRKKFKNRF